MKLATRLGAWLLAVHAALAAVAAVVLLREPAWLYAVEALFLVSLAVSWRTVRLISLPAEVAATGAELLGEADFTSRFRTLGAGEVDQLVVLFNEMSERLRRERLRLEEQHLFLEKLVEAAPAGILIGDIDGRVASANPAAARLLGDSAEALVGRRLLAPPSRPAEAATDGSPLAAFAALAPGGSAVVATAAARRVKVSRAEFFDQGFRRSFVVLEDLTGELRAGEKAAYEKLIRLMSHEVNNSVGAVSSLLDSCRGYARDLTPEDREDFTGAMTVAVDRLEGLRAFMGGFAEVVRLPEPARERCDLAALVRDVLRLAGPGLARRRIALRWRKAPPDGPLAVAIDKNQFEQVLLNLLQNAAEAIGEDGEIEVELARERRPRRIVLAVRDTGPGIPAEIRDRLFTPFFSTKRDGRGLGLTLIAEILTRHGADYRLGDRTDGVRGAEFRLAVG